MTTKRIIIPELEMAPDIKYGFWNQDDKIAVALYYGLKDPQYIADYLKKSLNAVQTKAQSLGISYSTSEEEREEIIRRIEAGEI